MISTRESHRNQFWLIVCCWVFSYTNAPAWAWLTLLGLCGTVYLLAVYCEHLQRKIDSQSEEYVAWEELTEANMKPINKAYYKGQTNDESPEAGMIDSVKDNE